MELFNQAVATSFGCALSLEKSNETRFKPQRLRLPANKQKSRPP